MDYAKFFYASRSKVNLKPTVNLKYKSFMFYLPSKRLTAAVVNTLFRFTVGFYNLLL